MYILYQNLKLIENIMLFQKVEAEIRRNLSEQNLQRNYIEVGLRLYFRY